MSRTIQVVKHSYTIDGKKAMYVEVWEVPEDFTEDEVRLLAEICTNGVLNPSEAKDCVRNLRK